MRGKERGQEPGGGGGEGYSGREEPVFEDTAVQLEEKMGLQRNPAESLAVVV